jgi:hypothetical protein
MKALGLFCGTKHGLISWCNRDMSQSIQSIGSTRSMQSHCSWQNVVWQMLCFIQVLETHSIRNQNAVTEDVHMVNLNFSPSCLNTVIEIIWVIFVEWKPSYNMRVKIMCMSVWLHTYRVLAFKSICKDQWHYFNMAHSYFKATITVILPFDPLTSVQFKDIIKR